MDSRGWEQQKLLLPREANVEARTHTQATQLVTDLVLPQASWGFIAITSLEVLYGIKNEQIGNLKLPFIQIKASAHLSSLSWEGMGLFCHSLT